MITIDGQDIYISHGDTLDVLFELAEGYKIAETDTITFSAKATSGSSDVLMTKTIPFTAINQIAVKIPAEEMAALTVGAKVYDIVVSNANNVVTLNFPAKLVIKEVAHNVGQ